MSEDLSQVFTDFGALGYDDKKMKMILGVDDKEFQKLMKEKRSFYDTGKAKFDFAVDRKLMQQAADGDLKAISELNRRKRTPS